MSLNKFAALALTTFAAACGGGGNNVQIIDTPEPIDSPPIAACPVCGPDSPCTLGEQNPQQFTSIPGLVFADDFNDANGDMILQPNEITSFGANSCGANGTTPCDLFVIPETGGNAGKEQFFLLAGLVRPGNPNPLSPLSTGDPNNELLLGFELTTPTNGVFPTTANPVNFSSDPTAILSANFLAEPQGTTAYQAIAYIGVVQGTSIVTLYQSTSGSIVIDVSSQGTTGAGNEIKGHVTTTNFSETDGTQLGGCTTSLEDMVFGVTQGEASTKRNVPAVAGPSNGKPRMSAEAFYRAIKSYKKH